MFIVTIEEVRLSSGGATSIEEQIPLLRSLVFWFERDSKLV